MLFTSMKWEDWAGVALAVWLIASPFVLGFSDQPAPMLNALILGLILLLTESLELVVNEMAEKWLSIGAGLWLLASPFVLGYASQTAPSANAAAVGVLTVILATWAMSPLDENIGRWWRDHVVHH